MRFLLLWTLYLYSDEYFIKSAFVDYFIPESMYNSVGIILITFSQIWLKALSIFLFVLIGSIFFKKPSAFLEANLQIMLLGSIIFIGFYLYSCLRTLWISPDPETLKLMQDKFGLQHANAIFNQGSIIAFSKLGEWFALPAMIFLWFRLRKNALILG